MDWFELLEFAQDTKEARGAAWMFVAVLKEYDRQKAEDAATAIRCSATPTRPCPPPPSDPMGLHLEQVVAEDGDDIF